MKRASAWLLVVLVVGCVEQPKTAPLKREKSLYTRLGGDDGMRRIVDDFATRVQETSPMSQAISQELAKTETRARLVRGLCYEFGGACEGGRGRLGKALASLGGESSESDRTKVQELFRDAILAALPKNADMKLVNETNAAVTAIFRVDPPPPPPLTNEDAN